MKKVFPLMQKTFCVKIIFFFVTHMEKINFSLHNVLVQPPVVRISIIERNT